MWHPIETIPKNEWKLCFAKGVATVPTVARLDEDGFWEDSDDDKVAVDKWPLTHWHDLPELP